MVDGAIGKGNTILHFFFHSSILWLWFFCCSWSSCSRTCGGGVMMARRECDSPPPSHGGAYCKSRSVKYASCNTEPCDKDEIDFRSVPSYEYSRKKNVHIIIFFLGVHVSFKEFFWRKLVFFLRKSGYKFNAQSIVHR